MQPAWQHRWAAGADSAKERFPQKNTCSVCTDFVSLRPPPQMECESPFLMVVHNPVPETSQIQFMAHCARLMHKACKNTSSLPALIRHLKHGEHMCYHFERHFLWLACCPAVQSAVEGGCTAHPPGSICECTETALAQRQANSQFDADLQPSGGEGQRQHGMDGVAPVTDETKRPSTRR